ncbi:MAG TPA: 4-hydroxythreonine-4-phosphate dehydrogenase PdxA [Rubricoccaceae bacterium]|jgi:4-hydroxythreonine-4-phosphate dehydrogenase
MHRPPLLLTLGDPNGIGPEVVLKAARLVAADVRVVAVGSATVLEAQAEALGLGPVARVAAPGDAVPNGTLAVLDPAPVTPAAFAWGETSAEGGRQAVAAIEHAVRLCLAGQASGLVTAPISKEAIHAAGSPFPGHTEMLQALTGAGTVVMVLAADLPAGPLRVALVTVHVPVSDVAGLVTADRVHDVCTTLAAALRDALGIARPRLAVLGLNPHAGDGGVLGTEEQTVLAPALARLRAAGIDAAGPFPADAFFGRQAWTRSDAVVAMYHDQGLAPFKALAQGAGVNVTLGLPIVRTSPDHGTAFDVAGQGVADPSSMIAAIRMAAEMAARRAAG